MDVILISRADHPNSYFNEFEMAWDRDEARNTHYKILRFMAH